MCAGGGPQHISGGCSFSNHVLDRILEMGEDIAIVAAFRKLIPFRPRATLGVSASKH